MEEVLKEYMEKYEFIKFEYDLVKRVCQYLSREIKINEVGNDKIRNRPDAWNFIIEWNSMIRNQVDIYNTLSKEYPPIPPVDFYEIRYHNNEIIND